MPNIPAVTETLDGVDEALHPFYEEHDGKFHLQFDDSIRENTTVLPLANAHERTKAKLSDAEARAKKAETDLAEALKGKPDEAALAAERKQYEDKIAELEGKLTDTEGKLTGVTRDQQIRAGLEQAGITDPFYVDLLTAKVAQMVKMEDGKAVVDSGMGPKDFAKFAKEQAAGDWKKAVTPPAGGGAKGKDDGKTIEKNPWAKETHNLTEQARILQSDPALAERLKSAAGSK